MMFKSFPAISINSITFGKDSSNANFILSAFGNWSSEKARNIKITIRKV